MIETKFYLQAKKKKKMGAYASDLYKTILLLHIYRKEILVLSSTLYFIQNVLNISTFTVFTNCFTDNSYNTLNPSADLNLIRNRCSRRNSK